MKVNRAVVTSHSAMLFSDFGIGMAQRYVPQAVIDAMPRFVRGKHVGKPKGVIVWKRVDRGGWVYEPGGGHVEGRVGQNIDIAIHESDYMKGLGKKIWSLEIAERQAWKAEHDEKIAEYEETELALRAAGVEPATAIRMAVRSWALANGHCLVSEVEAQA